MSTSSQSETSPLGPAEEKEPLLKDQITSKGAAEVMPWPKQNLKQATATLAIQLLAKRQAIVLRVLASFNGESTLQSSLMATADALKMCFSGVRVSIGLHEGDAIELAAISQQADVDGQTAESELICAVMREALEKDHVVVTNSHTLSEQGMQAHRLLCAGRSERQVVTMPMYCENQCIASLCLERDSRVPVAQSTIDLIRQTADMLAPAISARRQAERGLGKHATDKFRQLSEFIPAPRYIKYKALGLLLLGCLVFAYSWQTTHWIKADAELIPLERRVVAAPHEGFVHSVDIGSGEQVSAGDVLLRMDTSDANVQSARWLSELRSLNAEMRAAMAVADRRQMAILAADIDKTEAQLALVESALNRASIVAPVDGVVVSGDLTQMLGAPVSRGQLLLELAPEKGYEVHLLVDGDKINRVRVGAPAKLKLQTWASDPVELVIDRIHPIGIAADGANRFRVIASIVGDVVLLKPGQTGVGKIDIGKASLWHILTGDFVAWLKLKKWEWIG